MTATTHRAAGPRRADAGMIRLSQRDINGLLLCAEHGAAPYDLLAGALGVAPARLRGIVARWRRTGYATTGRLGPGPAWCWLTPAGMTATGLRYPATRPALGRLAHLRAVLAARLWLQDSTDWHIGRPWWQSERRIRCHQSAVGTGHRPDAEIHWPSLAGSPHAGQVWAIEVELTPKPSGRTAAIVTALTMDTRYHRICYLAAPAARPVLDRTAAALPPPGQITVWDLPPAAFTPGPDSQPEGLKGMTGTAGRERQ